MSDQYSQNNRPPSHPTSDPYGLPPRADLPPERGGSGLRTGALVAGVFIVVAILAATLYAPQDASTNVEVNNPAQTDGSTAPVAPATDTAPAAGTAPATDVPATDVPATDAPVTDAPATNVAPAPVPDAAPAPAPDAAPATPVPDPAAPAPAAPANP